MNEKITFNLNRINYFSSGAAHNLYNGGTQNNSTLSDPITTARNISFFFHKNMTTRKLSLICVISSPSSNVGGSVDIEVSGISNYTIIHRDRLTDIFDEHVDRVNASFLYPTNQTRGFVIEDINIGEINIILANPVNIDTIRVHSYYGGYEEFPITTNTLSFNVEEDLAAPDVVLSPPPAIYNTDENIVVNGYLNNGTSFVFDTGLGQPVITEYIGYDTLGRKLIAVTQDGIGGNMYFDGGFPKYYNSNWNTGWTSFNQLTVSYKLLYNAINFTINQNKLSAGNNKILFLCDAHVGANYSFDYTTSGFRRSIEGISSVMGLQPTLRSANEFPSSIIDLDFDYINQFASIVFFSTNSSVSPRVSVGLVSAIATYRALGNGLIFITDHGGSPPHPDTQGFFRSANEILKTFNTYFYGDVNTSATSIGFLRNTYGDHPLYNNLNDSEVIPAIGSVSEVSVPLYTEMSTLTPSTISTDGFTSFKFLIRDSDNTIRYQTYSYGRNVIAPFKYIDSDGNDYVPSVGSYKNKANINIEYATDIYSEIKGLIKSGANVTGEVDITRNVGFNREVFYNFKNEVYIPRNNVVSVETTIPVSYNQSYIVNRRVESINDWKVNRVSRQINNLDFADYSELDLIKKYNYELGYEHRITYARQIKMLKNHMEDKIPYGLPTVVNISQNDSRKVLFSDVFYNNTVGSSTFHSVKEAISCTYTIEPDGIVLSPITGAYSDCGVIINAYNSDYGYYDDYIFIKVDPLPDILGMVYNTYDFMITNVDTCWMVKEVLECLLVRIPGTSVIHQEASVFQWINLQKTNNWTQTQLRQNIKNTALSLGYTFYDDYNTALVAYYDYHNTYESYIKLFVGVNEGTYCYMVNSSQFVPCDTNIRDYYNTSRKIINQQTTHEFFITPERLIMYDFVAVPDVISIKQRSFMDININTIVYNDTPADSTFNSLVSTLGCNVSVINSNTLRVEPTVRKGETSQFNYSGATYFGKTGIGTQPIIVTEMDYINAIGFTDQEQLDVFKHFISPPSGDIILSQWPRTDNDSFWLDPATVPSNKEASLWYIDGSGNFIQPNNTANLNTIVSPEFHDDFTLEVELTSNNGDDDWIGLVAAGNFFNGEYVSIVVGVHVGGLGGKPRFGMFQFDNTVGTGFDQLNQILVGENGLGTRSGWSNVRVKVKIVRTGNIIRAYRSNYNGADYDPNIELVLDMTTLNTKGQQLLGKQRYGFATLSQPNSRYLNYDFVSPFTINVNRVYDLHNDIRVDYVNGSWVNTAFTARSVLDYPREVINTLTDTKYYLDFTTATMLENNGIAGEFSYGVEITETIVIELGTEDEILDNFDYNGQQLEIKGISLLTGCTRTINGSVHTITKTDTTSYFWIYIESETGVIGFKKILL